VKTPKIKMKQYLGHNYLKIIVTSRTPPAPMRPMKANQITVSTIAAPTVGVSAGSGVYPIQKSLAYL
jgi:hypothetical protein